ncbi:MAG: hypothetical protein K0Q71_5559, partial [Thermomicrobiales bacterium]|nr:hypothetical protein [Thermomicrobiales bacterium]
IRIPVDGIRIAGRNTQGVTLFDVAEGEHVVSVARLAAAAEANGGLDEAGDAADEDSEGGASGDADDGAREAADDEPGGGGEPGGADGPGEE